MTSPNMRLYEPGPLMKRIAKEPRATNARLLIEQIEELDPENGPVVYNDVFIIGGLPLEVQCLRRHLSHNRTPLIDLTMAIEFPCNGRKGYAVEVLSVIRSPIYNKRNIRSTIELSAPGRMAEVHLQMCIGRPLEDVIECYGILEVLKDRKIISISHEKDSTGHLRMRFVIDDQERVDRVLAARYPKIDERILEA